MTKEPQMTAENLEEFAERYNALDKLVAKAVEAARAEEVQRCMADVCEGCAKGWPLDPIDIKGEVAFHRRPHITYEDAGEEVFRCGAWEIRSRTSS